MSLFLSIVLDGVGIGAQSDAPAYGDQNTNTLGHVVAATRPRLPHLTALGIGCIRPLEGIGCPENPRASYGRMQAISAGKDSTTGHWELAGLRTDRPFPTYPDGFPDHLTQKFIRKTRCGGVLGNYASSGTEIIEKLGDRHRETGYPIVYTSADSVFQIAAHRDVIALSKLYRMCTIARDEILVGDHAVGRVIARPFDGESGGYFRISSERRDYSLEPPAETLQETLQAHHVETVSIGKVADLFGGVGFDRTIKTSTNAEGIRAMIDELHGYQDRDVFIWTNLVEFDQDFGHRNDPVGFARALEEFDRAIPELLESLPEGARMMITADHGNDPTTPGTDHTREEVPVLLVGGVPGRPVGLRNSFNDHAATIADFFEIDFAGTGTSFL